MRLKGGKCRGRDGNFVYCGNYFCGVWRGAVLTRYNVGVSGRSLWVGQMSWGCMLVDIGYNGVDTGHFPYIVVGL